MADPATRTGDRTPKVGRFQAGGPLGDDALYVPRRADRELLEALSNAELCFVLATTQMGKSSLKVRTRRALEATGTRAIDILLARDGTEIEWYYQIAKRIVVGSGLDIDVAAFWDRDPKLGQVERWSSLLRDEVMPRLPGRVVVFLDEINALIGLALAEPFLASLREMHDTRAGERAPHTLTFCLLGIAFPEVLIKDAARTPFRAGRPIAINDFTREELDALAPGLERAGCDASALLDEVFAWTHGHPYMTQRLCALLAGGGEGDAKDRVRRAVEEAFLDPDRPRIPNLQFAEMYLVREGVPAMDLASLYRRVLEGDPIEFDPSSAVAQHLCLSGLLAARAGSDGKRQLEVRNKVFAEVLGLRWVKDREGEQIFGAALRRWVQAGKEDKRKHLLEGLDLTAALAKVKQRVPGAEEEAFLRASQEEDAWKKAREADLEKTGRELAEERVRQNARTFRGVLILVVVALGAAVWVVYHYQDELRIAAEHREKEARLESARATADAEKERWQRLAEKALAENAKLTSRLVEDLATTRTPAPRAPTAAIERFVVNKLRHDPVPSPLDHLVTETNAALEPAPPPPVPPAPTSSAAAPPPPSAVWKPPLGLGGILGQLVNAKGEAAQCRREGGPRGTGQVALVLDPKGSVSSVVTDERFASSEVGRCVDEAFHKLSVPAFAGGPFVIVWSFVVR